MDNIEGNGVAQINKVIIMKANTTVTPTHSPYQFSLYSSS